MTPVLFHFITPDGVPLANARVDIQLSRSSYDEDHDGVLMPRLVEATTDEDGKVTVELAPADVLYHVECWDTDSEAGLSYKFLVPEQEVPNTPIRLQDIVIVGEMSNTSYDEAALIAIHAAKATALTAAISATASAAAADASADIAAAAVDEINGHMADPTGAHAASAISNTPAGGISATTVQAAINELDTEKARLDGAAFTGAVSAPGFTGPLTGNVTGNVSGSAPAGSLAGTTLAANVVNASLSSITPAGGTLAVNGSVGVIGGSYVAPSNGQAYFYASSALGLVAHGKGSSSDITLLNGDGTEVARVPTGTTNLLIGQTTNPSNYKLAVNGNVGVTGTITAIESGTGGGEGGIVSATQNAGGNAGVRLVTGGATRWAVRTLGAADGESISFYKYGTGAGDKVLFGPNGNVLIGQTSNPNGYKLAVTGNVGITGSASLNSVTPTDGTLGVTGSQSITGNLGIGYAGFGNAVGASGRKMIVGDAATANTPAAITVYSGAATYGGIYFADGWVGDQAYRGYVEYNHATDTLSASAAGGAGGWSLSASGFNVTGSISATGGATINSITPTGGALSVTGIQTITANSASAALDVVQNGVGYAIFANKFIGITGSSDVILGLNNTTPSTGRHWLVNSNADGTLSLGVAGVGDYAVLSQSGSLFSANSASPALTLVQSGAGRALLTTGSIEAGSFVGALIGNVTGNVSGSAGSVAAANLTGTTLASGVTAASLNSITPGGDLLDVIGHVIRVGRYGSGTGGNVRFVNDDGVQHWLAGMLGSVGYRRYSIYDIPNAREILGIDATSGQVQLGYGLGVTGAVAASTRFNLPAFTIATLPAAGAAAGLIYVADEAGGAVPAFSDGTNWRRVTDRAVVS